MKNPLAFPKQVTIDLERFHQAGLEQLANMIPHQSDELLLKLVISRGLLAMLDEQLKPVPLSPEEVSRNLESAKGRMHELRSKNAFPSRMNMMIDLKGKEDWADLHAKDEEYDRETARMRRDLGLADTPEAAYARPLEHYIGMPLSEDLRPTLEAMLSAHPDLEEENLYAALLELGLKVVQSDPKAMARWAIAQKAAQPDLDENDALRHLLRRALDQEEQRKQTPEGEKAAEMLRLAERLHARWKRRCG